MKKFGTPQRTNEATWRKKEKCWRIDVQLNGKRRPFRSSTPGRKGKIECEAKADEWLENGITNNPRIKELYEDFLKEIKRTSGSGDYVQLEKMGRLYLTKKYGMRHIASMTNQDWQNCITAVYEKGLSRKTCSNVRGAITRLYKHCRMNRIGMERPEFLSLPKNAPVRERSILQPEQVKTLFQMEWITRNGKQETSWCIHAWRFIVLTGLRRGECCGLQWEDINDNVLRVARSINAENEETKGKTKNAQRPMYLSPMMLSVLAEQKEATTKAGVISPWIFPEPDGGRMNPSHISNSWAVYRRQHGLSCGIHELRHTMISLVSPSVPDALLKPIVGHSEKMDTDVYRHRVEGQAEEAADLIDGVFTRILNPQKK